MISVFFVNLRAGGVLKYQPVDFLGLGRWRYSHWFQKGSTTTQADQGCICSTICHLFKYRCAQPVVAHHQIQSTKCSPPRSSKPLQMLRHAAGFKQRCWDMLLEDWVLDIIYIYIHTHRTHIYPINYICSSMSNIHERIKCLLLTGRPYHFHEYCLCRLCSYACLALSPTKKRLCTWMWDTRWEPQPNPFKHCTTLDSWGHFVESQIQIIEALRFTPSSYRMLLWDLHQWVLAMALRLACSTGRAHFNQSHIWPVGASSLVRPNELLSIYILEF